MSRSLILIPTASCVPQMPKKEDSKGGSLFCWGNPLMLLKICLEWLISMQRFWRKWYLETGPSAFCQVFLRFISYLQETLTASEFAFGWSEQRDNDSLLGKGTNGLWFLTFHISAWCTFYFILQTIPRICRWDLPLTQNESTSFKITHTHTHLNWHNR